MKNRYVSELIAKAKCASLKNRGCYPETIVSSIFNVNGTTIETTNNMLPTEPAHEADVLIDPTNSDIVSTIAEIADNSIISVSSGEINLEMTIDKGITIQGENVGNAQNYNQEV